MHTISRSSELRTVESNETIKALLTGPEGGDGKERLMLTSQVENSGSSVSENTANVTQVESLDDSDPKKRADAVEVIESEIGNVKEESRLEKIQKLEELLKDENNRVRANAAKAIYEVDNKASIDTLKDMLENPSKRMRASAVWALGEIATEDAYELLCNIEDESDELVTYNIKTALDKIKKLEKFKMSEEQQKKTKELLEKYKELV